MIPVLVEKTAESPPSPPNHPPTASSSSSSSLSTHVWAGFFGGLVGTVVSYPFDTLRVVSQTSSSSSMSSSGSNNVSPAAGLWKSYKDLRHRGLSLYSGIGPAMMSQGLLYGFLFGTHLGFQNFLEGIGWTSDSDKSVLGRSFVAGLGTGVASAPFTSPLEMWKIRLQTQSSIKAPFSVLKYRRILQKADLFRGLPATALRCAVGNSAFFTFLTASEMARSRSAGVGYGSSAHDSVWLDILNGGISGIVYWVVCMPFDVIKTRQQARLEIRRQSMNSSSIALEAPTLSSSSILKEASKIIRTEGFAGLWRGLSLAMYRTIPMQASIYCVYKVLS